MSEKVNLLNYDRVGLEKLFVSWGEPRFRAQQIMKWIYQDFITDFDLMTNISKGLRSKLADLCEVKPPEIVERHHSSDGTQKWLVALPGKGAIETVYIPDHGRATLCISSQAGCKLNCSFCHTAKQGFQRDLTVAEIVGQIWQVSAILSAEGVFARDGRVITNVVMMGMGEPLLNFDNVVPALKIMRDELGFGLSKKRVTLSTSGVVPQIYALNKEVDVALAVSLHAPDDELRNELVPINKKYPIEVLLAACKDYVGDHKKRHVTMEYVMLKGINDTPRHAKGLVRVLQGLSVKINLIPFNPFPASGYERSTDEAIQEFQQILMRSGYNTLVRRTRGDDIIAACGQLAGQVQDRTKRSQRYQAQLVTVSN